MEGGSRGTCKNPVGVRVSGTESFRGVKNLGTLRPVNVVNPKP